MSVKDFLSAKVLTLCFLGIGWILMGILLLLAGNSFSLLGVLTAAFLMLILFWLTADFLDKSRRFRKLKKISDEISEKYLLGEVLPKPSGTLEKQYFYIMKEISRSAVGIVEEAKREKEEYCNYVESWIHELKTPLTSCSLILANDRDPRKLKQELKRADNLTENILYYARLRTAEKDLIIQEFSAAQIIREAVTSQMELLISAKISIDVAGDFLLSSDSKSICFILKQLLINCVKYCPGCHIQISAQEGQITVEDNGIGIPSHELKRITERGFTGRSGKALGGSTGMGLYLVNELCRQLEIDLKIQSVYKEFTRVILSFPHLT